jgi:hypothetical protein
MVMNPWHVSENIFSAQYFNEILNSMHLYFIYRDIVLTLKMYSIIFNIYIFRTTYALSFKMKIINYYLHRADWHQKDICSLYFFWDNAI